MPKLIMCKGLPASGKTTWAKEQIDKAPKNSIKRVNKDDLRAMLDNYQWSKGNEEVVLHIRDCIIYATLAAGKHIIVDDTNLVPKHEEHLRKLVKAWNYTFEIKDFTDVDVSTCVNRDRHRSNYVGEKVIRDMYTKFLKPKEKPWTKRPFNPKLENCIIVDIDGTLANNTGGRGWYEYDRVKEDTVHGHIKTILHRFVDHNDIIIISGRYDDCEKITHEWLKDNNIPCKALYMRKTGDDRKDSIIKREIFEQYIEQRYNVLFVLDDRNQVVDMWRNELNIPCLQCAPGDF